uniref:PABP n=1 Tax=Kalanchoe fedtschenkoi TaxID=63787 RepID=A0A7N0UCF2_KALFE
MAQVQAQNVAAAVAAANAGGNQVMTVSMYVGDLEPNVTDSQLYDMFSQMGQVVSVRVCRDLATRRSLGYGYVNYSNPQDAARALEHLNFTPLNGKPIRIMYSHRDPSIRRTGAGNIFIKNLDKVTTDTAGQSKGYGFVQFDNEESAQKAIEQLNGMLLNDKQVYVAPFMRKQEREANVDKTKFNNVFVKNLAETTTEEDLRSMFARSAHERPLVMKDADGKSRCFGFVNFENADDAAKSVEALNGYKFQDKEWYVGKAQKKYERENELKQKYEQSLKEAVDKYQGTNLYVKNLDDSVDDDKLKELFAPFGSITSCKVMRDPNGISRGSGFVAFSTPEEAARALAEMNGKMVISKPLYVAVAQRKEERRARLQAQFSQMRPAPGFGYQQQLVPGMRPGGAPVPNFFLRMVQPGQQGQRPGDRRGGAIQSQQNQYQVPVMQHQMLPRGLRGMPEVPMPGIGGGMLSFPYDIGGAPMRDAPRSQQIPIGALATALANAPPDQHRTMLGENLYPLVEQLEPKMSAKVTGMLLEMEKTEVLHLLESPEGLKAKVAESMEVLRSVAAQQQGSGPADQLASLSLNDN